MGDRVVDCARLESVCTARYQGFESLPIRHHASYCEPADMNSRPTATTLPEIRTQFDRRREARCNWRSQIGGANAERWQSLPIRHLLALVLVLTTYQTLPAQTPKISSTDDLMIAAREYQAENFDAAIAALDRFDKSSAPTVDSLDLRGCIYMEQQKFDAAKTALQRAHEVRPDVFAPRIHMGDLLLRQKKFADAREIYATLLRETNILISHERLKFVLLLTYLGEHNETGAKEVLDSIKFPTESAGYYYSQAAWAFAHDKKSEGQNWLGKAQNVYTTEAMTWFAHHMYHFGWLKKKPPLSQIHA